MASRSAGFAMYLLYTQPALLLVDQAGDCLLRLIKGVMKACLTA
jgi:hypothetical protein